MLAAKARLPLAAMLPNTTDACSEAGVVASPGVIAAAETATARAVIVLLLYHRLLRLANAGSPCLL